MDALLASLLAPTQKDVTTGLNPIRFSVNGIGASAASTTVSETLFTTPPDRARLLTGIYIAGTPGAGQQVVALQATHVMAGGSRTLSRAYYQVNPLLAAAAAVGQWFAEVNFLMLPGDTLFLQANFSAGGVANTLQVATAWGLDFPRANIEAG